VVSSQAKERARCRARNAVNDGSLSREPCECCGVTENVHGHHDDYSEPLDVRWLCPACHSAEHTRMREEDPTLSKVGRPANPEGSKQVLVVLTDPTLAKLDALAKKRGLNRSECVRDMIRRAR